MLIEVHTQKPNIQRILGNRELTELLRLGIYWKSTKKCLVFTYCTSEIHPPSDRRYKPPATKRRSLKLPQIAMKSNWKGWVRDWKRTATKLTFENKWKKISFAPPPTKGTDELRKAGQSENLLLPPLRRLCFRESLFVCLCVCGFVCVCVCEQNNSKSYERIFMKFSGYVRIA